MNYSYLDLLRKCNELGTLVEPRGTRTKELIGAGLQLPMGVLPRRAKLNRALGYMELCQWVAAAFDPEGYKRVAPGARHELFTEQMAYGPRMTVGRHAFGTAYYVENQLQLVADELTKDPASRRAVVMLSRPEDTLAERPCTTSVQWFVRNGALYQVVTLRSWDLWWGAPYDLVMYQGLGLMMGRVLNVAPGWLTVNAGSAHVYEPFWGKGMERQYYAVDYLRLEPWLPMNWYDLRTWAGERAGDVCWVKGPPAGLLEVSS